MAYDSTEDTLTHIERVRELLKNVEQKLSYRGFIHDNSKLVEPEKSKFDELTPRLRELTYGSPEYKASLAELGEALHHHYRYNRHHPEYHAFDYLGVMHAEDVKDGTAIRRMNLLDLIEMLIDWKAASERHENGDIIRSILQNEERFGYSEELRLILLNTAEEMGWTE